MDLKHIIGGENPIQTDDELLKRVEMAEADIEAACKIAMKDFLVGVEEITTAYDLDSRLNLIAKQRDDFKAQLAALVAAGNDLLPFTRNPQVPPKPNRTEAEKAWLDAVNNLPTEAEKLLEKAKECDHLRTRFDDMERLYWKSEADRDTLAKQVKGLMEAFDIPSLTGVWHYHRQGMPTMWCATYIDGLGICDTEEFDSPWKALEAAKAAWVEPSEGK